MTRAPPPSAMTKPSRRRSKGLEIPELESAVMLVNAARPISAIAASAPPVMTASQRPYWMRRAALPMDWVPAAHAVTTVSHGPRQPNRIEMAAAPALPMIIGHEEGRHPAGAFLDEDGDLLLQGFEAADTGAEDDTGSGRVDAQLAGIVHARAGRSRPRTAGSGRPGAPA